MPLWFNEYLRTLPVDKAKDLIDYFNKSVWPVQNVVRILEESHFEDGIKS